MASELNNDLFTGNKIETHVIELPAAYYPAGIVPEGEVLYCVSVNGNILKTPKGTPITNQLRRPLRQLANEIADDDPQKTDAASLYGLSSIQLDVDLFDANQYSPSYFQDLVIRDPLMEFILSNKEPQFMSLLALVYHHLDHFFIGFDNYMGYGTRGRTANPDEVKIPEKSDLLKNLAQRLYQSYEKFSVFERAVFINMLNIYGSCLAAQMAASSEIHPRELAWILPLINFSPAEMDDKYPRELTAKIKKDAECMRTYLDLFPPQLSKVEGLIQRGESIKLEFKSTLRWSLQTQQDNPGVTISILKTIVAFLNTDGGTLLVGVEDNGNILGIAPDHFDNEDKYLLHFSNIIKDRIGKDYIDLIHWELMPVQNKKVLIVECNKSPNPAFLVTGKQEDFYIRNGPSTDLLTPREFAAYIKRRFNN